MRKQTDSLRSSGNLHPSHACLSYKISKLLIKWPLVRLGQSQWNMECDNKLRITKPVFGVRKRSSLRNGSQDVLLRRLHIGYSYISHKCHCGVDSLVSEHSGDTLTIIDILCLFSAFDSKRRTHFPELFRFKIPSLPVLVPREYPLIPLECLIFDY